MHKKRFRKPACYRENFIAKLAFATDGICFSGNLGRVVKTHGKFKDIVFCFDKYKVSD